MNSVPGLLHHVLVDVEGGAGIVGRYDRAQSQVANVGKQRAVDFAAAALFVVAHQCEQRVIVVAGDVECAVVVFDKLYHGM